MKHSVSPYSQSLRLWIDETNAKAWADACHREIAVWLSVIAGEGPGEAAFARNLKIEVRPPSRKAAERAFHLNSTLVGEIGFRWFDQEEVLRVPMPYHGVFLFHRDRSRNPLRAVWPSWLGERHAFRIVRPTYEFDARRAANIREWRIGLPDGRWMGASLANYDKLPAREKVRFRDAEPAYLGVPDEVPDWLKESLGIYGPRGAGKGSRRPQQTTAAAWRSIHRLILKKHEAGELPEPSDEDDLNHRILITFPVWLLQRISLGLRAAVLPRGRRETENWRFNVKEALSGLEEGTPELAAQARDAIWNSLQGLGAAIERGINGHRSDDRADYIDPINPLELVSRITRIRRLHERASRLEEKPAEFRQNHPSFRGRVCPVESPESGQVGLAVHLASGAAVDFAGKIHPAPTPIGELGFGAGLVPFFAHNDGVRNMMGAKNMRQAIPVRNGVPPAIVTGGENAVATLAKPLVEAGLCPPAGESSEDFHLGRDLLVAYIPWRGMNVEDAVVLGQQVLDKGLLDSAGLHKAERKPIKLGWVPADPEDSKILPGLESGLVTVGTRLAPGAPIACFGWEGKERAKQRVIRYMERTPVIVKRIEFHRKNEWTGGILEYELELPIPIRPGDKLMGRHGNKGVVGAILPESQMPRLPDTGKLPGSLRGRPVDVLLNPHGVISRMNLGQLLETHVGWLLHSGECVTGDLRRDGQDPASPLAAPFADVLDHEKVQAQLTRTGLDRFGRIRLVLPDGGVTVAPVVVGFQHMVRLRQIPELKSQARRGGREALYSARTGQAIHGKKFGGGQRLGEMEVWALAAHQADAVLAEMLGIKSSADMIAASAGEVPAQGSSSYSGHARVLQDWLFALGIDLASNDEKVALSFLERDALLDRIGKENEVTTSGGLESRVAADFRCAMGKRKPCGYELLDGEKIEFNGNKNSRHPTLTLGDVLAHLELRPAGKLVGNGAAFEVLLADKFTGTPAATLEIAFECGKDFLKGVGHFTSAQPMVPASPEALASLADAMMRPEGEKPKALPDIHLYGRFGKGDKKGGGNWSAEELLEQFQSEESGNWWRPAKQRKRCVTDMTVTCPRHRHQGVWGTKPFGEIFRSAPGGLFDPGIFGSQSSGFLLGNRWGYVKLPVPVRFPLHVFLTNSVEPRQQKKVLEKFRAKLEKQGIPMAQIPDLTHIPVLPTRYRLPSRTKGKLIRDEIERKGYAPLLAACRRYRQAPPDARDRHAGDIARRVEWLFRRLACSLEKKNGLIRRAGLGRRVDRSARLVVTPNPELGWDQVGIPSAVLLDLMGDLVEKWLATRTPEEAQANPLPALQSWSWMRPDGNEQAIEDARTVLDAFFEANEEFVVLLNRQPSLHRDSFQAFKPVPLPVAAGDVIQLCPLACKGFAADFDGDEMVVHVPLGAAAQEDARRLLPSRNPFSLAAVSKDAENVMAHFDQDFVMGTWFLGRSDEAGLREEFLSKLPGSECRALAEAWNHPSKKQGAALLCKLLREQRKTAPAAIAGWMRSAHKACTKAGVSFGFYELREIAHRIRDRVQSDCAKEIELIRAFTRDKAHEAKLKGRDEPDYNSALAGLAREALEEILAGAAGIAEPGVSLAAMAMSGARGKKQVRQLIAARGMLDPGKTGFDPFEWGRQHFFFSRSLVDGLAPEESFWAAMNARSSMIDKKLGTGYAGGLTRSMVFALWPIVITTEDCGSTKKSRSPATCCGNPICCARCYGELPEGGLPPIGFPAGLVAAQSIGERGTQLSMRSFHAGASAIDIHAVREALGHPAMFGDGKKASDFVAFMKKADAYQTILDRHFEILWRVIRGSEDRTLQSAIRRHDILMALAHRHSTAVIAQAVLQGLDSDRAGPIAKILLGGFRSLQEPKLAD